MAFFRDVSQTAGRLRGGKRRPDLPEQMEITGSQSEDATIGMDELVGIVYIITPKSSCRRKKGGSELLRKS